MPWPPIYARNLKFGITKHIYQYRIRKVINILFAIAVISLYNLFPIIKRSGLLNITMSFYGNFFLIFNCCLHLSLHFMTPG